MTLVSNWRLRVTVALSLALAFVVGFMSTAIAAPTPQELVEDALGDAAETAFEAAVGIAVQVLPFAAILLALYIGWRMVRRFIK